MKVEIDLYQARKLYNDGGEGRNLVLTYFKEEDLKDKALSLPISWEDFCKNVRISDEECFIQFDSSIERNDSLCKMRRVSQLHQPKGWCLSKGYYPLTWHVDKCSY